MKIGSLGRFPFFMPHILPEKLQFIFLKRINRIIMETETIKLLKEWAATYHCASFIPDDPVQFPHRYTEQCDIEISGLLTAVLSFGNRKMILRKADELDAIMGHSPLQYILSEKWRDDFRADDKSSFYRMVSHSDFRFYLEKLYSVYSEGKTLEDKLLEYAGTPMQKLCAFLEASDRSPQKKLNMFLRWMVRQDSPVDFGVWKRMSASDLIIPLDTHVCRVAHLLGLTDKPVFSLTNAKRITNALAEIFPGDPCMGDFSLFGYGVNNKD